MNTLNDYKKIALPEFVSFRKIPRLSRDCVVTEKLDGTGSQILISPHGDVVAASRKRYLTVDNDNHGFARWVEAHKDELLSLGVGRHYGEWMGQKIQRTYGLKEKRFYLFNVGRWVMAGQEPGIWKIDPETDAVTMQEVAPACCHVVPKIWEGVFDTSVINTCLEALRLNGSYAVPGFMNPEGVIVYHMASGNYYKKTFKDEAKGNDE